MLPPPGPGPIEDGPFTAFGQYGPGRLDVRVLNQGTWWVNRDGVAFRIDSEMSDEYVSNVLAFLFEHAVQWHMLALLRFAVDDAEQVEGFRAAVEVSAEGWLEATALVQALRRRLRHLRTRGR